MGPTTNFHTIFYFCIIFHDSINREMKDVMNRRHPISSVLASGAVFHLDAKGRRSQGGS